MLCIVVLLAETHIKLSWKVMLKYCQIKTMFLVSPHPPWGLAPPPKWQCNPIVDRLSCNRESWDSKSESGAASRGEVREGQGSTFTLDDVLQDDSGRLWWAFLLILRLCRKSKKSRKWNWAAQIGDGCVIYHQDYYLWAKVVDIRSNWNIEHFNIIHCWMKLTPTKWTL